MHKLGSAGCETEEKQAVTIRMYKAHHDRGRARRSSIADLTLENTELKDRLAAIEAKLGVKKAPKAKAAPKAAPKAKKKKKKKAKSGNGGR